MHLDVETLTGSLCARVVGAKNVLGELRRLFDQANQGRRILRNADNLNLVAFNPQLGYVGTVGQDRDIASSTMTLDGVVCLRLASRLRADPLRRSGRGAAMRDVPRSDATVAAARHRARPPHSRQRQRGRGCETSAYKVMRRRRARPMSADPLCSGVSKTLNLTGAPHWMAARQTPSSTQRPNSWQAEQAAGFCLSTSQRG